jgi:hypothetical protein
MTDAAGSIYAVDSSSLMDWQGRFYPTDVFKGLAERIEELVGEARFLAPALVQEEVDKIGTTELAEWVGRHQDMIVPTAQVLTQAQVIQRQFAGLLDPKAEYEEADAYVIALARLRGGTVITQETSASEKRNPKRSHYIPDVCRELGIPCISFLGLMRREGWRF